MHKYSIIMSVSRSYNYTIRLYAYIHLSVFTFNVDKLQFSTCSMSTKQWLVLH